MAARGLLAERGFDRTSIRAIARAAGVDPALVLHYHGSKQALFVKATDLPIDPEVVLPALLAGDPERVGERVVGFMLMLWSAPEGEHFLALIRSAASDAPAAEAVRDLLTRRVFGVLTRELGVADADLRATLAGSQVVGLAMARLVIGLEPLASAPVNVLVAAVGPTIQRYLTGELGLPVESEQEER